MEMLVEMLCPNSRCFTIIGSYTRNSLSESSLPVIGINTHLKLRESLLLLGGACICFFKKKIVRAFMRLKILIDQGNFIFKLKT